MGRFNNENTTSSVANSIANSPPPFLSKTYDMVEQPSTDSVVSWSNAGNSFVVWRVSEFSKDLLPKYFKHNNFSSFVRQLNTYGFRKVESERWEFANEGFLRGQKHLLKGIGRKRAGNVHNYQHIPQAQTISVGPCVEVGKFGMDEEVESLIKDKNVLMLELVRLRQQQQGTDNQLQTVAKRVHLMEQRQKQLMSFLAKAMRRPGVFSQLVKEQNESNRRISGVSKKRRLPDKEQEEENFVCKNSNASSNGRVASCQPLINEAAKSMLRQILNISASARLEENINSANDFLIGDVPPDVLDRGSSSSGAALLEVLPTSPEVVESGFVVSHPSAVNSVAQPFSDVLSGNAKENHFPEVNVANSYDEEVLPNFFRTQEMVQESTVENPNFNFKCSRNEDIDLMSECLDAAILASTDEIYSNPDIEVSLDDTPKLPGINDIFWEQFLSADLSIDDTEEVNCNIQESVDRNEQELKFGRESAWERTKNMNHLTKQIGLLASGSKRG